MDEAPGTHSSSDATPQSGTSDHGPAVRSCPVVLGGPHQAAEGTAGSRRGAHRPRREVSGYRALAPWQNLNFLPEPHGQGALRAGSFVPVTVALFAALAAPDSFGDAFRLGAE